ncbi:MAG TPA: heptaprenylglyceryl phosphate synthase [Bacilli bacterium]|nr:heptaprenylglyceryl phosphate synthase [Bacilli bacterium]
MLDYYEWRHAFKLDPNKEIDNETLEAICESGTDGIIVGGTDGVTLDNTLNLLARVRRFPISVALEVSNLESITPGFDHYFIPTVLNSADIKWMVKLHHSAVREYGKMIDWEQLVVEGYCILNEDSKVAKLTQAETELEKEDVIAYAQIAEKMYRLPIFYVEYSGRYGDVEIVSQVKEVLNETRLFYGGGIVSAEQAKEMGTYADTVIVGNIIYDDLKAALSTVQAVKTAKQ